MGAKVCDKNTQSDETLDLELETLIATVESMGAEVRDRNTQSDETLDLELEALIAAVDQLTQDHPNERSKELLMETTAQLAHLRMSWQ